MAFLTRLDRRLCDELTEALLDGSCCVRSLVWVDADYDHSWSPFTEVAADGAPADMPQWGRKATLLSGHAGAPRIAAGDTTHAGQTALVDSETRGQPADASEPNRRVGHEPVRKNQDDTEVETTVGGSPAACAPT